MAQYFSSEPIRVMVVEDDSVTRKALCLSITASPALELTAEFDCAKPALEWLESGSLDVLLTDLFLPDGHGIEIIHQCSKLHPRCDIMVLTTSSSEVDVLACIEAGASGYLLKGSSKDDIANAVLNMRQGGAPMTPVIARMVLDRMRNGKSKAAVTKEELAAPALTKKEKAILDLIARGESYGDIASMLTVTVGTVQTHIKSIYTKLSVHSRSEAVFEAQRKGLINPSGGMLN